MKVVYYFLLWIHLISMAGLWGLLISCKVLASDKKILQTLSCYCKTFFALLFVSGFLLLYLKVTSLLQSSEVVNKGIYHILTTKFIFLMGLGHFIFVGSKKDNTMWVTLSLIFIALASFLGLLLRNY